MEVSKVLNLYFLKNDKEYRVKELSRVNTKHLFKIGYSPLEKRFVDTIKDVFGVDILKDLFKMPKSNINHRVGFKRIKIELEKMKNYLEDLNYNGIRYVKTSELFNINNLDNDFKKAKYLLDKYKTTTKNSWFETMKLDSCQKVVSVFNSKVCAITNGWVSLATHDPYLYELECIEIMIETCEYVLNSSDPKNYFVKLELV